jgi:hypothetical protein
MLSACSGSAAPLAASTCDWQTELGCSPVPHSCRARGALPDPACTPGALNPAVTPATLRQTICVEGWTRTVRPPVSYTGELKRTLMDAYRIETKASSCELDHLIPLELGGAPADVKNLWPEAHTPRPGSYDKDGFEDFLRQQVCAGQLELADAQQKIADDWLSHWIDFGSPASPYRSTDDAP